MNRVDEHIKVIQALIEARKLQFIRDGNTEAVKSCETILHDLEVWLSVDQALRGDDQVAGDEHE